MGKATELTPKKRAVIVALHSEGLSYSNISAKLNVSKGCISQTLKKWQLSLYFRGCHEWISLNHTKYCVILTWRRAVWSASPLSAAVAPGFTVSLQCL